MTADRFSLQGKTALVTGASSGLGAHFATVLAKAGAKVAITARRIDRLEKLAADIRASGATAVPAAMDVTERASVASAFDAAEAALGPIDIVVNNAGILRDTIFHRMTKEEYEAVINVNLNGVFYVSRAAAPHFKAQNGGCYVQITSSSGLIGNFGQVNYCSAKMGVVGMSKAIAMDMQRFNVRSNAVAPWAWTRMVSTIPAETEEQKKRVEGLKKLIPEKIAPFVAALATDQAKGVNGQIFGVRNNEIYLFSQSRPIRTAHTSDGWTPESIIDRVFPMFENDFYPLHRSGDVFTWDPV